MFKQKDKLNSRYFKNIFGSIEKENWTFLYSRINQNITNLPFIIWISPDYGRKISPRIIVQTNFATYVTITKLFAITIKDNPKIIGSYTHQKNEDVEKVVKFIQINKTVLLDYYYQNELDIVVILHRLKKYTNEIE